MVKSEEHKVSFEERLDQLAEAYGVNNTSDVTVTEVLDLHPDLSDQTVSQIMDLSIRVAKELDRLYEQYGRKPNIIVDRRFAHAAENFMSAGLEMVVFFIAQTKEYGIEFKTVPEWISEDFGDILSV